MSAVRRVILFLGLWALLSGCASLISSATSGFAEDLASAILDNEDIDIVKDGAPAYLLLMDGLLSQSPDNLTLLNQSARLNSAYASAFVAEPQRAKDMQAKALKHAKRAVCLGIKMVVISPEGPLGSMKYGYHQLVFKMFLCFISWAALGLLGYKPIRIIL